MVLKLARVRNTGIRIDLGGEWLRYTSICGTTVKTCSKQMDWQVWTNNQDLEIIESELLKSEKWWWLRARMKVRGITFKALIKRSYKGKYPGVKYKKPWGRKGTLGLPTVSNAGKQKSNGLWTELWIYNLNFWLQKKQLLGTTEPKARFWLWSKWEVTKRWWEYSFKTTDFKRGQGQDMKVWAAYRQNYHLNPSSTCSDTTNVL